MRRKDDLQKLRCDRFFSLKNKALWSGIDGATFSNWHLLLLETIKSTGNKVDYNLFTTYCCVFEVCTKPDTGYFVLV